MIVLFNERFEFATKVVRFGSAPYWASSPAYRLILIANHIETQCEAALSIYVFKYFHQKLTPHNPCFNIFSTYTHS